MDRPKVLATTVSSGWVRVEIAQWVANLRFDERFQVDWLAPVAKAYEAGLNLVSRAVVDNGYDWWLNIDSDNPPIRNPLDMIGELGPEHECVGLPTPIHKTTAGNHWLGWSAFKVGPRGYYSAGRKTGLERVRAVGSGCLLVRSGLLKRVFSDCHTPFERRDIGPDLAFCERLLTEFGVMPWVAWDYPCSHFKELDLGLLLTEGEAKVEFPKIPAAS